MSRLIASFLYLLNLYLLKLSSICLLTTVTEDQSGWPQGPAGSINRSIVKCIYRLNKLAFVYTISEGTKAKVSVD